jgi:hypothetical protein
LRAAAAVHLEAAVLVDLELVLHCQLHQEHHIQLPLVVEAQPLVVKVH